MTKWMIQPVAGLHDPVTGQLFGFYGADGKEYYVNASVVTPTSSPLNVYNQTAVAITGGSINGTTVGATTPSTGSFTTLAASGAVSGVGFTNYLASPPAIGGTAPGNGTFLNLRSTALFSALTDGSGTPGNVTQNVGRGRAAFAAASNTVTVTNSQVAANSTILISLGGTDATLTTVRVTPAAGSFTVTGNAAATGIVPFDYVVIQN